MPFLRKSLGKRNGHVTGRLFMAVRSFAGQSFTSKHRHSKSALEPERKPALHRTRYLRQEERLSIRAKQRLISLF